MQFCVAAHYNFLILFSWHQRLTQGDSDQNEQSELLKCLKISHFSILAFSTNFCPIKSDLSGNHFWHF